MSQIKLISKIQNILKQFKSTEQAIKNIAPHIATLSQSSRVIIFKNHLCENTQDDYLGYLHEFCNKEITPCYHSDEKKKVKVYYQKSEDFKDYAETLAGGMPVDIIKDDVGSYPESIKEIFEDTTLKSASIFPIITNNELWGTISLHFIEESSHFYDQDFVEIMLIITGMLSNFIERQSVFEKEKDLRLNNHSERMAAIGKLTASITHEVNNPNFIVQGYVTRLLDLIADDRNEEVMKHLQHHLDVILKNSKRITSIVDTLKLMAREPSQDDYTIFNITETVNNIYDVSKDRFQLAHINLNLKLEDDLMAKGCPTQFMQVVSNLLNNSYDSLTEKDCEKWINIEASNFQKYIRLTFTDSGPKLDSDIADNIMEPFYTTKAPGKGTGLGLNICRELIKNFGGSFYLDMESPNVRFVMLLPKS